MKPEKLVFIKYLDPEMPKIKQLECGDWIDLCCVEDVDMKQGEFKLIKLGVVMELPSGYEALLLPRSSTFKKYGILTANSMGVIDNSYCGPEDEWMLAAFATRDTHIDKYTRIAQFRILQNQPAVSVIEVEEVGGKSRGGFGSTGEK